MTGDKGLCGACNSGIVREVKAIVQRDGRERYEIYSIGEKGTNGLVRPFPDMLKNSISEIALPFTFSAAASIAHQLDRFSAEHNLD